MPWQVTLSRLYNILAYVSPHKPNSQFYSENFFREQDLHWRQIYLILSKLLLDCCYVRSFQYKVLNNVPYMSKKPIVFGTSSSPLWSFCENAAKTILHLFYECNVTKKLWKSLNSLFLIIVLICHTLCHRMPFWVH